MKTAPTDREILVWGKAEGELSSKDKIPSVHHVENFCGIWNCVDCNGYSVWVSDPEYWMELPKGPKENH